MQKIALVHDDFTQDGGAESLFAQIAAIFPDATIYTSLVKWDKFPPSINKDRIKTSFIQRIDFAQQFYKAVLPLYPLAFESFNFDDYDVVISSTTRFAKAIITKPHTLHICYINSAPRFLYEESENYLTPPARTLLSPYLSWLKKWDLISAARVDYFIANSKNVQMKIKKIYGRESEVIYPGVDTDFYIPKQNNLEKKPNYYLVVSRLVKWKRIEIAIEATRELSERLIIVGNGPDYQRLGNYGNDVEIRSKVTKNDLQVLYQNCKALIVTQEEDFGIAAVEAQACGKPVIAFEKGGVKEIVVNGKTGLTFKDQTTASLKDAIQAASKVKWYVAVCRKNALRFSRSIFTRQLEAAIEKHAKFRT